MKCPKCKSDEITARMTVRGLAYISLKTRAIDLIGELYYDNEDLVDFADFTCNRCSHEWWNY